MNLPRMYLTVVRLLCLKDWRQRVKGDAPRPSPAYDSWAQHD